MKRSLCLGVLAAIAALGCAAKTNNDGSGNSMTSGGTGGAAANPMATGAGGSTGGAMTTGTGGSGTTGTPGTGGSAANPMAGSTGGTSGGMTMGTGGKGGAGMGAAGSGGSGSGGAPVIDNPDAGTKPPEAGFHPPCVKKGGDLVLIGDSYVNYIESLEPRLTSHAIMDGVLMQGDKFDDHAVAGTSLAANVPLIPPQWDEAKPLMPKFVVMDGGGNDILLWNNQCLTDGAGNDMNAGCQQVVMDAEAAAKKMMDDMIASGVKQILYYFYPNTPAGGHDILNYSFMRAKKACEDRSNKDFECMFVDLRPVFQGHDDWFMFDGIHPTAPGMDAIGETVWGVMKDHCMAQTAAQNCGCTE